MSELKQKLRELKELFDEGLIDEAEYAAQKAQVLAGQAGSELAGETRVAGGEGLGGHTRVGSEIPEQLGSYQVLSVLGAGGMGTVVRARHVEDGWARRQGGDVAIKLIHPQFAEDPSFRERFFAEAELGRKVQHASIASVFDVVSEGRLLGTVMSLVEGRGLESFVRPGGMALSEAVGLLKPLAEALDHLHGLGVVHRDLKPQNIKVRPDGTPVVLDLGIAKDIKQGDGLTGTATAMGTVGWMAPEQADAKRVGPAADRYALGMIAYALLAGRMPWSEGTSEARILTNKLTGQLEPLARAKPELSGAVSDAVSAMTALDAARRPASCGSFVRLLEEAPGAAARAEAARREEARRAAEEARRAAERARQEAEAAARREQEAEQARDVAARKAAAERARQEAETAARLEAAERRAEEARRASQEAARGGGSGKFVLGGVVVLGVVGAAAVLLSEDDPPPQTVVHAEEDRFEELLLEAPPPAAPARDPETLARTGQALERADLDGASCHELWVWRNWIYARHGYAFTTDKAQTYFGAQSGYERNSRVTKNTVRNHVSSTDIANKDLLVEREKELGCD